MYVCGDLPHRRRLDLEPSSEGTPSGREEIMTVEIALNKKKWLCSTVYKQPQVYDRELIALLESTIDKAVQEGADFIVSGDLNVNVLERNHALSRVFQTTGIRNIVKKTNML